MRKITSLCLVFLLLVSCKEDKKEEKTETSLTFQTKSLSKSLDDCTPENGNCTFISLTFPVASGADYQAEKINREIEKFLVSIVDYQEEEKIEKPEELAEDFIANYKETAEEFPEYELPWEATVTGKIIYQDADIISMEFDTDMFTGGAHGYRSTNYLNFDRKTGKKLTATDLFKDDFKKFVEKDFRKKYEIPSDSNINSTGMFFEDEKFRLPENIGISQKKILLHYNAYEIASYAAGNFNLQYPKKEIQQFLKISDSSMTR
ncbi:DUF3298 and DUF4163 domain-containing protein [Christiangramia fulva]|uniref:DUF3298 and DUF4163 domain-containing protein n=1 Tax=Christiangramia fulva TaxID=2126553 RepID=UPI00131BFAFC|nr:DUF3298 and DUF4163 domain-containing protein [Christiangramia fulva]